MGEESKTYLTTFREFIFKKEIFSKIQWEKESPNNYLDWEERFYKININNEIFQPSCRESIDQTFVRGGLVAKVRKLVNFLVENR